MQIKTLFKNDDFTTKKFIIFVILAPVLLLILEILMGVILHDLYEGFTYIQTKIFFYSFYLLLGLWIAAGFYKFIYHNRKKFVLAVIIALVNLIILKYFIAINFIAANNFTTPGLTKLVIVNILIHQSVMLFSLFIFTIIFLKTENKLSIYEVKGIKYDVEDPETKLKHDMGICSKCGGQTKITNVRLLSFMGKGDRYFCDNCGVFIRGNPLQNTLVGITVAIFSSFLIVNQFVNISNGAGKSSSIQSIVFLVFLYGIFDGCKMSFAGIKGLVRNRKTLDKKEEVVNNIQVKVDYQELDRKKKIKRIIAREGLVIITILIIGLFTFSIGKQGLKHYKDRYWKEIIVKDERYLSSNPNLQEKIKKEYNDLLFIRFNGNINKEYGLGSYIVYCLQFIGFWLLRLGYPFYLIIRFIIWAVRTLKES